MDKINTPYLPFDPAHRDSNVLVTIKEAATAHGACEGTLKANAKSRRLRAYQAHFGSPVLVLPSDVEEFLRSRPDVASNYHPKAPHSQVTAYSDISTNLETGNHLPSSDVVVSDKATEDADPLFALRSLAFATPAERTLVANALVEIAGFVQLIPPTPTR